MGQVMRSTNDGHSFRQVDGGSEGAGASNEYHGAVFAAIVPTTAVVGFGRFSERTTQGTATSRWDREDSNGKTSRSSTRHAASRSLLRRPQHRLAHRSTTPMTADARSVPCESTDLKWPSRAQRGRSLRSQTDRLTRRDDLVRVIASTRTGRQLDDARRVGRADRAGDHDLGATVAGGVVERDRGAGGAQHAERPDGSGVASRVFVAGYT